MKTYCKGSGNYLLILFLFSLPLLQCGNGFAQAQRPVPPLTQYTSPGIGFQKNNDAFGGGRFISNIGQYNDSLTGFGNMGKILYGYEGLKMPVLFTPRGLIHLQRSTRSPSAGEIAGMRKKGMTDRDIWKQNSTTRFISMEWVNANPRPVVIAEEESAHYVTYLFTATRAKTYNRITYKELYPGIDLVYSIDAGKPNGFEYSLVVAPGASPANVQFRYGGDVKTVRLGADGRLTIASDIEEITVSAAASFYADDRSQKIATPFRVSNNSIRFSLPASLNKQRGFIIDPFVSGTGTLTGADAGKAKDVDFDYAGNMYVVGGGDGNVQRLSKYNAAGVLQWTFNGTLNVPCWEFGTARGGWCVDKINGNIYLGQGINNDGFKIIRLDGNGDYDNYSMDAGHDFTQNWKMLWNCNDGNANIYIAGGGGSGTGNTSNVELIRFAPASHTFSPINITGVNTGNTDISDMVMDPANGQLFTLFSTSILDPAEDNKLFKHKLPFSHHDIAWSAVTGCHALHEPANRPYLSGLDNSSNTIAVNAGYLFYWDGRNLKAFNKNNGNALCATLIVASNQLLMQGGIIADECNNVYAGSANGIIKVYRFNGSSFDDDSMPDIIIPGYTGSIYDLAYNPERNLLYASGDGFVASFDLTSNCTVGTNYTVHITSDCSSFSATASLSPQPPAGTFVTYQLFDGNNMIASNQTGIFSNLSAGKQYSIKAVINQTCSGASFSTDFTAQAPASLKINPPAGVCPGKTYDLTNAALTAGSTAGLTYSYWTDAQATIAVTNPANVQAGNYFIKAVAANGCSFIAPVEIKALTSPKADAGNDAVVCAGNNHQLKGTGGTHYSWSPATHLSNPNIADPKVNNPGNPVSITYRLKVTDANGCESSTDEVKITFAAPATIFIEADSTVAINQPVQLNAVDKNNSDFIDYRWSPVYGLNNPFIKDPVARLDKDMTYTVQASNKYHCTATAHISIKVFRGPDIYVPNSFTPNGDGLNDLLRPIPVGLVEFHYLKIFNRFGHLLFTITDPARGWDGRIQGVEQNSGTYVWIAEGVDYKGNLIMRKGYSTLIR